MTIAHETEPWAALLEQGRTDQRLVHDDFYDARSPRLSLVPEELGPAVMGALANAGIEELYSHQSQALYAAFEGPTIVTTGTASGKSLCFQLPTLQTLTADRPGRVVLEPAGEALEEHGRRPRPFHLLEDRALLG